MIHILSSQIHLITSLLHSSFHSLLLFSITFYLLYVISTYSTLSTPPLTSIPHLFIPLLIQLIILILLFTILLQYHHFHYIINKHSLLIPINYYSSPNYLLNPSIISLNSIISIYITLTLYILPSISSSSIYSSHDKISL